MNYLKSILLFSLIPLLLVPTTVYAEDPGTCEDNTLTKQQLLELIDIGVEESYIQLENVMIAYENDNEVAASISVNILFETDHFVDDTITLLELCFDLTDEQMNVLYQLQELVNERLLVALTILSPIILGPIDDKIDLILVYIIAGTVASTAVTSTLVVVTRKK